ncbi:amidohydrolase family protein [Mycolicibacterium mengxianglii]|uniref:amidohydrolase family protein n=1 Tax=Mycolicibacterium mengxianglii TaxID=2736649 RepID=UPI0018D1599E|nr:amidohydrolase family protein [Mycolicibacterium mengxianglii]
MSIERISARVAGGSSRSLMLRTSARCAGTLSPIAGLDRSITEYLQQNVWVTASGMLDPALLHHALAVTTPDRILFSTDYPFQSPTREELVTFLTNFADDESRIAFASGNAQQLFTIT